MPLCDPNVYSTVCPQRLRRNGLPHLQYKVSKWDLGFVEEGKERDGQRLGTGRAWVELLTQVSVLAPPMHCLFPGLRVFFFCSLTCFHFHLFSIQSPCLREILAFMFGIYCVSYHYR
ncbi:hypothetical protein MANES_05G009800v8 [Manihot esculenta]|uniref:Uncharacterized protein n=1 Tax=Manihot esculenta TaxID=3983 RepID=A0A2C9VTP8_MANES|nr:hypothetical protein MANES_05G009800v8 [Manihot esculenta]